MFFVALGPVPLGLRFRGINDIICSICAICMSLPEKINPLNDGREQSERVREQASRSHMRSGNWWTTGKREFRAEVSRATLSSTSGQRVETQRSERENRFK